MLGLRAFPDLGPECSFSWRHSGGLLLLSSREDTEDVEVWGVARGEGTVDSIVQCSR